MTASVALLAGCGSSSGVGDTRERTETVVAAGYESFADCDELLEWTKQELDERVTAYGLGGGWPGVVEDAAGATETTAASAAESDVAAPAAPATAAPDGDQASTAGGDGGTSTTNTQELGVDEGDIVETDGRFVYSVLDDHLRAVDLSTQRIVADLPVPAGDHQMLLDGDALLLVTQSWASANGDVLAARYQLKEGQPVLVDRMHLEGQVLATRAVGGEARVALSQNLATRIPFVAPRSGGAREEREALARNREIIDELTIDDVLPRLYSEEATGASGALRPALGCEQVGHPAQFSGFGLTWVAAVDLHEPPAPHGAAGVVADGQTVYASATALYVATTSWPDQSGPTVPLHPEPTKTSVHAFSFGGPDGADYLASGDVQGTVLNQYSMSEKDGHLRVATTTDAGGFGSERESGIHVLARRGRELVEVGSIGGLGRTEQIQAVRYIGDRAYVVTFRRTDPLYVIDLADPSAPRLLGELKIPGFSTYLHPVDDRRLLGIGFDATGTGQVTGAQLSLFDVADATNPRQLGTLAIGDLSEATFDPHAFLWWGPTGQVVVPKELVCERLEDCTSAVVATVDDSGIREQGRIFHPFPIRRSLVVDGQLVTVSAGGVKVNDLATLDFVGDIAFERR